MPPNVKRCDIVIGADMFILKSLFHALGGFDENIFLYEEELELQYRMRLEGYVNFILNDIGIIHLEGKSSTSYFHQICTFKSMCYILKKHFGCFQLLRYRLRTIVRAFLSVISIFIASFLIIKHNIGLFYNKSVKTKSIPKIIGMLLNL